MSDSTESSGRGTSVSLKRPPSKQYANDGLWIVHHGTVDEVREDLIKSHGLEGMEGATLHEVALKADHVLHNAESLLRSALGATPVPDAEIDPTDPWAQAAQSKPAEPEVSEKDKMLARVAETADVPALRDLYARNADLFKSEPDLQAAWNAKGIELQAAVKASE